MWFECFYTRVKSHLRHFIVISTGIFVVLVLRPAAVWMHLEHKFVWLCENINTQGYEKKFERRFSTKTEISSGFGGKGEGGGVKPKTLHGNVECLWSMIKWSEALYQMMCACLVNFGGINSSCQVFMCDFVFQRRLGVTKISCVIWPL